MITLCPQFRNNLYKPLSLTPVSAFSFSKIRVQLKIVFFCLEMFCFVYLNVSHNFFLVFAFLKSKVELTIGHFFNGILLVFIRKKSIAVFSIVKLCKYFSNSNYKKLSHSRMDE
jgi:hypothetical protein